MPRLLRDERVITPDGVSLATDVYLPDGEGPFPVVLERTPYGKTLPSRSEVDLAGRQLDRSAMATAFTQQGMAVVFQDCRGRHGSTGVFTKYVHEAEDGISCLDWISGQPWSDGRIGTMGLSYAAHTQLALACLNPAGLVTMVLDSGGFANAHSCGIRQGGAFELKQATWAYRQARLSRGGGGSLTESEVSELADWFRRIPWHSGDSPLADHPDYEAYLLEQWQRGDFDDYWQRVGLCAELFYHRIPDIPVLHLSSWYDAYVPSTLQNYRALSEQKSSAQRLIMGPWLHGDRNQRIAGDVDFGPAAPLEGNLADSWLDLRLEWFARCFEDPQRIEAGVEIFCMGGGSGQRTPTGHRDHGGEWLRAERWPLPGNRHHTWYLDASGGLTPRLPSRGERMLLADPEHPVPTIGGSVTSGAPLFVGGAFAQRELEGFFGSDGSQRDLGERDDVLSFVTEPLTEDLVVAGEVRVEVWLTSDGPDCDIAAKLIDVGPDGYPMNITDSITRVRYRDSASTQELLQPGQPVRVTVTPFATCNRFAAGHRIRLDLAGSNFPHFDVNPNSGEPIGQAEHKRIARTRIHCGPEHPSQLTVQALQAEAALP